MIIIIIFLILFFCVLVHFLLIKPYINYIRRNSIPILHDNELLPYLNMQYKRKRKKTAIKYINFFN